MKGALAGVHYPKNHIVPDVPGGFLHKVHYQVKALVRGDLSSPLVGLMPNQMGYHLSN